MAISSVQSSRSSISLSQTPSTPPNQRNSAIPKGAQSTMSATRAESSAQESTTTTTSTSGVTSPNTGSPFNTKVAASRV